MQSKRRNFLAASATAIAAGAAPGLTNAKDGTSKDADTLFQVNRTTIPVIGTTKAFPVRRIYCIGRNYAAHALERGSDPTREPPFFFQKPTDAIQVVSEGVTALHPYPPLTKNYHHEVELVAAIHRGGRNISPEGALSHVYAYAIGLDMTRRDLQNEMSAAKRPWEIGKSFDHSAVIGNLYPVSRIGHVVRGTIQLAVNGQTRQSSDLSKMIWNVAEQISKLSQSDELFPGDLVYSGTPENVGPVVVGDVMTGRIEGMYEINVKVV